MFDRCINEEIVDLFGRELRGKLNDALVLILLSENTEFQKNGLTTKEISEKMKLPQSTVATVIARLLKRDMVEHSKGKPVMIKPNGIAIGMEMVRHHRLLEIALVDKLELSHNAMHDEAIKLMLLVSCNTINTIDKLYNQPTECPGGSPIPKSSLCYR